MSFCHKCGTPLNGNSVCSKCGTPIFESAAPKPKGSFFSSAGSLNGSPSITPEPVHSSSAPVSAPKAPVAPASAPKAPIAPASTPKAPIAPASAPKAPIVPASAPKAPIVPASASKPPRTTPAKHDVPPASAFPPSVSTPTRAKPSRRISAQKELKLLLRQGVLVLLGEKRNLIISLLFPFLAAIITVWIAGKNMFTTYEATKSACFILVCAAIWGGLFNSIQSLVKERENIKRDYVSGALRIECYMGSRAIIQFVLCLVQSFVLSMSLPAVEWVHGNNMPSSGLFGGPVMLEFYITLFLIMYASDALGLLISSIVKKEELASKLAPYILIAQLLFSGVLFELKGAASSLSSVMISRWGMEALGSISKLNNADTTIYYELVDSGAQACPCGILESLHYPEFDSAFKSSSGHLATVFFIMLLFVVVPLVVANIMLHRVKNDGRD